MDKIKNLLSDYQVTKCEITKGINDVYTVTPSYGLRNSIYDTLWNHDEVIYMEVLERDSFNTPSTFIVILKGSIVDTIEDYIIKLAEDTQGNDLIVDADTYNIKNNTIEMSYNVRGGYEYDINYYWGGEEYVEDFMNTIDHPLITSAEYTLDEEDLCGQIIIHTQ